MSKRKQKFKLFTPEGHPVMITKKGKHKIYIDIKTNKILMTNPIPLALLAALAPTLIEFGSSLLSKGKEEEVSSELPEEEILQYIKPKKKSSRERALEIMELESRGVRRGKGKTKTGAIKRKKTRKQNKITYF